MIETIPYDLIMSFTNGLLIAYAGRDALAHTEGRVALHLILEVMAFQLLVFCPVGTYLYATQPAWSWNYFVDPAGPSGWLGWVGVAGYAIMGLIGAIVGVLLARRGQRRMLGGLLLGGLALQGLFFLIFASRFWWVGSYSAFHGSAQAASLVAFPSARLGHALFGIGPVFVGVLLWIALRWRRFGRRLRQGPSEAELAEVG